MEGKLGGCWLAARKDLAAPPVFHRVRPLRSYSLSRSGLQVSLSDISRRNGRERTDRAHSGGVSFVAALACLLRRRVIGSQSIVAVPCIPCAGTVPARSRAGTDQTKIRSIVNHLFSADDHQHSGSSSRFHHLGDSMERCQARRVLLIMQTLNSAVL